MSDTVTIHNGHCSYHGPADKAPVWAAQAASADHKISPAPTRSPMNSIAPVPAQTVSADAIPAPLTSFEDTTHAWEEGYRAGQSSVQNLHNAPSGEPAIEAARVLLRDEGSVEFLAVEMHRHQRTHGKGWLPALRAAMCALADIPDPQPSDTRPERCRFRLQDEGKAFPRSACWACGRNMKSGLGNKCSALEGGAA